MQDQLRQHVSRAEHKHVYKCWPCIELIDLQKAACAMPNSEDFTCFLMLAALGDNFRQRFQLLHLCAEHGLGHKS